MKIRMWYALPAIVVLAACAVNTGGNVAGNAPTPSAAAPQRVDAVSNALGAKMDGLLASQRPTGN
ncbi:MAG TPA: hypothetical protein VMU81_07325 [Acetobacteraceae bacterium]|nr:hypothetical protein [Acetobacteraceae bacterium]